MQVLPSLGTRASHYLLHKRWLVVFLMAFMAISFEVIDHAPGRGAGFDSRFVREVVVSGLLLPLTCGVLLTALARAKAESSAIRDAAIQTERIRIARDLHDSLAQNLGYLRIKLDQFSHDPALHLIPSTRHELERMREVANAAYEQVQGELVHLYYASSDDLPTALLSQARLVASRAGFLVEFTTEGAPRSIPPDMQVHLYYLLREALTNIGKHAAAKLVRLRLEWTHAALTISLADDGRGFDPDTLAPNGHLGLAIMRERAREANALYALTSSPGHGTQLTVYVPLTPSGVHSVNPSPRQRHVRAAPQSRGVT